MRPDVKLGIVVSALFVMVAGTYFLVQDRQDEAIPVSSDPAALVSATPKKSVAPAKPQPQETRVASGSKTASARKAPRKNSRTLPTAQRTAKATPKRDPNAQQRQAMGKKPGARRNANTGGKRAGAPKLAQRNRSRNGQNPARRQPVPKKTRPQISLTATPAASGSEAVERHRVQAGDTMASLAKQYYGSTQFTQFLASQNKQIVDPAHLRAGDVVNIVPRVPEGQSPKTVASAKKPTRTPLSSRQYRIKSGDSFYRIAKEVLGDATRWTELYEMNKKVVGDDPAKLKVGQIITLPKK